MSSPDVASSYVLSEDKSVDELGAWLIIHGDEKCPHLGSKKINIAGALALTGRKRYCQVCIYMAGKRKYLDDQLRKAGIL